MQHKQMVRMAPGTKLKWKWNGNIHIVHPIWYAVGLEPTNSIPEGRISMLLESSHPDNICTYTRMYIRDWRYKNSRIGIIYRLLFQRSMTKNVEIGCCEWLQRRWAGFRGQMKQSVGASRQSWAGRQQKTECYQLWLPTLGCDHRAIKLPNSYFRRLCLLPWQIH